MRKILFLFLIWRTLLFLVAYLSPQFVQPFGATFPYYQERLIATGLPHFIWSFANFDGVHYLGIAKDLYAYQYTQAFFPLYPILIKTLSYVFSANLILSGLFISNISFLIGLVIFYRFIENKFNQNIAFWSVIFLMSLPTSFFFGSLYTEGLFFLLIILSFYFADKSDNLKLSIVGFFASLTRLVGVFIAPAIFFEAKTKSLMPKLIIPLGLIAYMVYLKLEFNNALYFLTSQSIFEQGRSTTKIIFLPQVFYRYVKILATTHGLVFANAMFELTVTIFALGILIWGYKKIPRSWFVFSILTIITPTLTGTLTSMPRYVLVAFPIFVLLANIKNLHIKLLISLIFIVLQIIVAAYFTQGYWVA